MLLVLSTNTDQLTWHGSTCSSEGAIRTPAPADGNPISQMPLPCAATAACCAEMVELDGMLVSAAAAERRKFFSALLQRAAKRRRDQGGGTLSLVLGMLGVPASGDKTAATAAGSRAPKALDAYKHLSPELKEKMAVALAAKAEAAAAAHVPQAGALPVHGTARSRHDPSDSNKTTSLLRHSIAHLACGLRHLWLVACGTCGLRLVACGLWLAALVLWQVPATPELHVQRISLCVCITHPIAPT